MAWEIEYTDEFGNWYESLTDSEQDDVDLVVDLLEDRGVNLRMPYSSGINGSRHGHMRELRIQHKGRPYRVLYAFDPRRTGILLLGGDKTGDDRWYETAVPMADDLYDEYIEELQKEGLLEKSKR